MELTRKRIPIEWLVSKLDYLLIVRKLTAYYGYYYVNSPLLVFVFVIEFGTASNLGTYIKNKIIIISAQKHNMGFYLTCAMA